MVTETVVKGTVFGPCTTHPNSCQYSFKNYITYLNCKGADLASLSISVKKERPSSSCL